MLVGARCYTYLLEKSRCTHQSAGERNYHAFHMLLAQPADTLREQFNLLPPSAPDNNTTAAATGGDAAGESAGDAATTCAYSYVRAAPADEEGSGVIEGVSDAARLARTEAALRLVGVGGELVKQLLEVVAAVVHLGQVRDPCPS